jgi:N6-L-threonylcarbamoyladenine synthase
MFNNELLTLAIESSCDETSVALVAGGRKILSNIIASQIDVHTAFGGVVPEIASRHHLENINSVTDHALQQAGVTMDDVDFFSVTYGPGLVGALLIGVATAKSYALATGKPLVPVHHIQGHISANYLAFPDLEPPFMALVVSGGHTNIVRVDDYNSCVTLGQTRDDAAGEAYDKVARVLGLGYPGGPKIDKIAREGDPNAVQFKRVFLGDGSLDFSFSGIKTGVMNYVNSEKQAGREINVPDVAASFQEAVLDVIVTKSVGAAVDNNEDKLVVAGGVAANSRLREKLRQACDSKNIRLCVPDPVLCTDNAAMIGAAGYYKYISEYGSDPEKAKNKDYLFMDAAAQLPL